jgi:hypothetical protein
MQHAQRVINLPQLSQARENQPFYFLIEFTDRLIPFH